MSHLDASPTETLQTHITQHGQAAVLTLAGPLISKQVAVLRRALIEAHQPEPRHLLIDLSEVDEIDGYGLSALVGILARRPHPQHQVVLFGLRPDIRERLTATFCDSLFPIRHTLAAALQAAGLDPDPRAREEE